MMFPRKRQRPNPSLDKNSNLSPLSAAATLASGLPAVAVASQANTITSDQPPPAVATSTGPGTSTSRSFTTTSVLPMSLAHSDKSSASLVSTTTSTPTRPANKEVRKSRSWYGTWPRIPKPAASTQVAHEIAIGDTLRAGSSPDFSRYDTLRKITDNSADGSDTQSTTTLPRITEADASVNNTKVDTNPVVQQQTTAQIGSTSSQTNNGVTQNTEVGDSEIEEAATQPALNSSTANSWLSWFNRPLIPGSDRTMKDSDKLSGESSKESPETRNDTIQEAQESTSDQEAQKDTPKPPATTSWFGFWGTSAPPPSSEEGNPQPIPDLGSQQVAPLQASVEDAEMQDAPPLSQQASQPSAGSTWAFWSRDTDQKKDGKSQGNIEQGELAVIGEGSEASPQQSNAAVLGDTADVVLDSTRQTPKTPVVTKALTPKKNKRLRPQSMDLDEPPLTKPISPLPEASVKGTPQKSATPSKTQNPSLLLPSFQSTYRMKENPSIVKQIAQLLLRTKQSPAKHVFLVKDPPRIKKAVAIGVHGLFPAAYLRPMIGQPTGTSIRFMNHCADAIRKWTEANGCGDCEIEKIALEGEGKIGERVDNLWKLLLNWIDHIRAADLIILACHSQGVPVGLMLTAKLIDLGIITNARIGVCAMAGVCLGPFPDYKAGMGMLMGSAAELWQFGEPESEVSKRLEDALTVVLEYGARVTYVGSIDDQVVPLESAIYSPVSHPYIYRAVFIDGRVHASDFIAHLIGFALKLRNLGVSDHGLIRELSLPLAGSLYTGEGHSRIYDDQQVYDLAVRHALETTSASGVPCQVEKRLPAAKQPNPYVLPWIMRGLLEEDFVKTDLSTETSELLRQFDDWEPSTKALKDVKFRLEAVRSKL